MAELRYIRAVKLTTTPQSFEYYRVYDQEDICRVSGDAGAQHLIEDLLNLTTTKTKLYLADWSQL